MKNSWLVFRGTIKVIIKKYFRIQILYSLAFMWNRYHKIKKINMSLNIINILKFKIKVYGGIVKEEALERPEKL